MHFFQHTGRPHAAHSVWLIFPSGLSRFPSLPLEAFLSLYHPVHMPLISWRLPSTTGNTAFSLVYLSLRNTGSLPLSRLVTFYVLSYSGTVPSPPARWLVSSACTALLIPQIHHSCCVNGRTPFLQHRGPAAQSGPPSMLGSGSQLRNKLHWGRAPTWEEKWVTQVGGGPEEKGGKARWEAQGRGRAVWGMFSGQWGGTLPGQPELGGKDSNVPQQRFWSLETAGLGPKMLRVTPCLMRKEPVATPGTRRTQGCQSLLILHTKSYGALWLVLPMRGISLQWLSSSLPPRAEHSIRDSAMLTEANVGRCSYSLLLEENTCVAATVHKRQGRGAERERDRSRSLKYVNPLCFKMPACFCTQAVWTWVGGGRGLCEVRGWECLWRGPTDLQ